MTGDDVYRKLMDLSLILQDISQMGPLKMFLGGITDDNPALIKLDKEITDFTARVESLVNVSR